MAPWASPSIQMNPRAHIKIPMLLTNYYNLIVTTYIYYLRIIIQIPMLSFSLIYKLLAIQTHIPGAFWTSLLTANMIYRSHLEISMNPTCYNNFSSIINVINFKVIILIMMNFVCLKYKLRSIRTFIGSCIAHFSPFSICISSGCGWASLLSYLYDVCANIPGSPDSALFDMSHMSSL